jgi:hypothetical protein
MKFDTHFEILQFIESLPLFQIYNFYAPPSGNIVFSTPAHSLETKRLSMVTYIPDIQNIGNGI